MGTDAYATDVNSADVGWPGADGPDADGPDARTSASTDTRGEMPRDTSGESEEVDTSPLGTEERPAEVVIPDDYDASERYPLVFLLHGYTASASIQDAYLGVSQEVDALEFVLVLPNGTRDASGKRFWNATSWCCNFGDKDVDDAAYLRGLIDEAEARFSVDPERIYFMGHSNGGFMSYRMACDYADRVAAVASIAGSGFVKSETCEADDPVAVLQIHGTEDGTIRYEGASGQYPGARSLMTRWVGRNECDATGMDDGRADFVSNLQGEETRIREWKNCTDGASTVLWAMEGAPHVPNFDPTFTPALLEFLLEQRR